MRVSLQGSCSFDHQRLFDDIEFDLASGNWTCLLGSSGSGKTTLLRLIAGLETGARFEGQVTFDTDSGFQQVAYMAQSDLLFPWLTVRQNVMLGPSLRQQTAQAGKVEELIERVGLLAHQDKKPHQLSGGMRQRAALARTLMEDTPVVLLDEPFAALDARTRSEMQELTYQALEGKTVLLVTHDPAEAIRLGHHLFIVQGKKLAGYPLPQALPVRPHDDRACLVAQAELLDQLRKGTYG